MTPDAIPPEIWAMGEEMQRKAKAARAKQKKTGKARPYYCPKCQTKHQEAKQPNRMPIDGDRCTAMYRQENGYWRVCHADFLLVGGPNTLPGPAFLCDPCWDRQAGGSMSKAFDSLLNQLNAGGKA